MLIKRQSTTSLEVILIVDFPAVVRHKHRPLEGDLHDHLGLVEEVRTSSMRMRYHPKNCLTGSSVAVWAEWEAAAFHLVSQITVQHLLLPTDF